MDTHNIKIRTLATRGKQLVWTSTTLRSMWPNCSTLQSNEKKVRLATVYKQYNGLEASPDTLNITMDTTLNTPMRYKHYHGLLDTAMDTSVSPWTLPTTMYSSTLP